MGCADGVDRADELDQTHLGAVDGLGHAVLKADLDELRLVGRRGGVHRDLEGIFGRRHPRVFEQTALVGASPQVLVDGVGALLGERHRQVARRAEVEQLLATHAPVAGGGETLEVRILAAHADLDAHLVVALAGAAVSDRRGPVPVSRLDQLAGDQRSRECAHQRVLLFVERVVHDLHRQAVDGQRALAGRLGTLHERLDTGHPAGVDQHGHHVAAVAFLQVGDHGGGVETA